jgi:hypothetical protein
MKNFSEILVPLAAEHGMTKKTVLAAHMSEVAIASGLVGRDSRIADATILAMSKGERNWDERLRRLALDTAIRLGLVPKSIKDMAVDQMLIDAVAFEAAKSLNEEPDQETKEAILGGAQVKLIDAVERYTRLYDQIESHFPTALAEGDRDTFHGQVFSGFAATMRGDSQYALYDLDDEARYLLSQEKLKHTDVIDERLEDVLSFIGKGEDRVRFLYATSDLYEKAAAHFENAVRQGPKEDMALVAYLAATARENGRNIRSELLDISERNRDYGGFDNSAAKLAADLLADYERSIGRVYPEAKAARRLKDLDAIRKLRPHEVRAVRSAMYDAIKEGNFTMVQNLRPKLAAAMNCGVDDVFNVKSAPQKLALIDEPGLQAAFAKFPKIAAFGGMKAKVLIMIVSVGLTSAMLVGLWDRHFGTEAGCATGHYVAGRAPQTDLPDLASRPPLPSSFPFDVVGRPGVDRLG